MARRELGEEWDHMPPAAGHQLRATSTATAMFVVSALHSTPTIPDDEVPLSFTYFAGGPESGGGEIG